MGKEERRSLTPAAQSENADRFTKQVIVYTLCGIGAVLTSTVCTLALYQVAIPEYLNTLVTFVVGNLSGALIKTSVEKSLGDSPVEVTNAPGDEIEVTTSKEKDNGEVTETDGVS